MKENWSLFCKHLEVLPLSLTTQGVSSPVTKDSLESRKGQPPHCPKNRSTKRPGEIWQRQTKSETNFSIRGQVAC